MRKAKEILLVIAAAFIIVSAFLWVGHVAIGKPVTLPFTDTYIVIQQVKNDSVVVSDTTLPCETAIPNNYRIVYNDETNQYSTQIENYGWKFTWIQYSGYPSWSYEPELFSDSCSAKINIFRHLEATQERARRNSFK